jgi:hypothetical protein
MEISISINFTNTQYDSYSILFEAQINVLILCIECLVIISYQKYQKYVDNCDRNIANNVVENISL